MNIPGGAWDFLNRLLMGNDPMITAGAATVSYSSGGGTAIASGTVLVKAYGNVVETVPEPSTILLLGAGIAGLIGFRRLRS